MKTFRISADLIDSDIFYALSYGAQLTYFHICMSCDKNGVTTRARYTARAHLGTDEYIDELLKEELIEEYDDVLLGYKVVDWRVDMGEDNV